MKITTLSIIIPAYNEEQTIGRLLSNLLKLSFPFRVQIIVVNDGSSDNTPKIVSKFPQIHLLNQKNQGKGAAIKNALSLVRGNFTLIQDADFEYDPHDIPRLLIPVTKHHAKIVYGSRNLTPNPKSSLSFYYGGKLLSLLTNLLYGANITDEATGYKLFYTPLLKSLHLVARGFDFCPEVTAKLLRQGHRITEVPISYFPRNTAEGKKITPRDGLIAIYTLFKYRFFNHP